MFVGLISLFWLLCLVIGVLFLFVGGLLVAVGCVGCLCVVLFVDCCLLVCFFVCRCWLCIDCLRFWLGCCGLLFCCVRFCGRWLLVIWLVVVLLCVAFVGLWVGCYVWICVGVGYWN